MLIPLAICLASCRREYRMHCPYPVQVKIRRKWAISTLIAALALVQVLKVVTAVAAVSPSELIGNAWEASGPVRSALWTAATDDGTVSLFVAVLSLFVAARAFRHDRQVTSLSGVIIHQHGVPENIELTDGEGNLVGYEGSSYLEVEILPRGPGTRYDVRGAVWAPEGAVDAIVETEQQQEWSIGGPPILITLKRHRRDKTEWNDARWHDVYVGAVWEQPSSWHGGFVTQGLRVKVPLPGSMEPRSDFETWSPLLRCWRSRRLKTEKAGPLLGTVKSGKSLAKIHQEKRPGDANPLELFLKHAGRAPGAEK